MKEDRRVYRVASSVTGGGWDFELLNLHILCCTHPTKCGQTGKRIQGKYFLKIFTLNSFGHLTTFCGMRATQNVQIQRVRLKRTQFMLVVRQVARMQTNELTRASSESYTSISLVSFGIWI